METTFYRMKVIQCFDFEVVSNINRGDIALFESERRLNEAKEEAYVLSPSVMSLWHREGRACSTSARFILGRTTTSSLVFPLLFLLLARARYTVIFYVIPSCPAVGGQLCRCATRAYALPGIVTPDTPVAREKRGAERNGRVKKA